jgi:beta-N-acetylglucosaminidase/F5/8 type C domain
MNNFCGRIIVGAFIMFLSIFFPYKGQTQETIPEQDTPNRAKCAKVRASSTRIARLNEVPRANEFLADITVAVPAIRQRWIPKYALDQSPLTFWASEESGLHWIELQIGNKLKCWQPIQKIIISWGNSYAKSYNILVSNDGEYWRPIHSNKNGAGGVERIDFEPPLSARAIRIEITEGKEGSVSIADIGLFGPVNPVQPKKIKKLSATSDSPKKITLTWEQSEDDNTYHFNIYRAAGKSPSLTDEYLVGSVDQKSFTDSGLSPDTEYQYIIVPESFSGIVNTLHKPVKVSTGPGKQFFRFEDRGVIEGFYNDPWPHQERLRMIEYLEDIGMNHYIYAPKVEPYHRQWWRKKYPEAEMKNFSELAKKGKAHGVMFNYGISPGLDFNFSNDEDMEALKIKLSSLMDVGVSAFTLCFDDIPNSNFANSSIGQRQTKLVNEIFEYLKTKDPDVKLYFVPTVYSRTYSYWKKKKAAKAQYLESISAIDSEVGIMWIGPGNVFSEEIDKVSAMELKELWNRPVIIWDNYPVNDVSLRFNIFTGPYIGRSLDLGDAVGGIFLNPMYLPNASKISLYTAGKYMTEEDYEPWLAYEEGLRFLGESEEGYKALKTLSDCLLPHPIYSDLSVQTMPVHQEIGSFWDDWRKGVKDGEAKLELEKTFNDFLNNPRDLQKHVLDQGLIDDLLPASKKLSIYGEAGLSGLELLYAVEPDRQAILRGQILEAQARARVSPLRVADEGTTLGFNIIGRRIGNRNVIDEFLNRALAVFSQNIRPQ